MSGDTRPPPSIQFENKGAQIGTQIGNVQGDLHQHNEVEPGKKKLENLKDGENRASDQVTDKFGTCDTVALLLSGVGHSEQQKKQFEQNLVNVEKMLECHFDIGPGNIYPVSYKHGETKQKLSKKMKEIRKNKNKNGNFLFYYLGHNNKAKQSLEIDDDDDDVDDYITYEDLKSDLAKITSPNKLFIIDTCHGGGIDLEEEDNEEKEVFPLFWDDTLDGEEDINKLQWRSSREEKAFFAPDRKIGFTSAIQDTLKNFTCTRAKCVKLRKDYHGSFVPVYRLHECVLDHVHAQVKPSPQNPHLDFNKGNEKMHLFPLIAKQT